MSDRIDCSNCDKPYSKKRDGMKCPHCGHLKWGEISKGVGALAVVAFLGWVSWEIYSVDEAGAAQQAADLSALDKLSLNDCVRHEIRTGNYKSSDGGKSAINLTIMCDAALHRELPQCYKYDPMDNDADNHEHPSPEYLCRLGVLEELQQKLVGENYWPEAAVNTA